MKSKFYNFPSEEEIEDMCATELVNKLKYTGMHEFYDAKSLSQFIYLCFEDIDTKQFYQKKIEFTYKFINDIKKEIIKEKML